MCLSKIFSEFNINIIVNTVFVNINYHKNHKIHTTRLHWVRTIIGCIVIDIHCLFKNIVYYLCYFKVIKFTIIQVIYFWKRYFGNFLNRPSIYLRHVCVRDEFTAFYKTDNKKRRGKYLLFKPSVADVRPSFAREFMCLAQKFNYLF